MQVKQNVINSILVITKKHPVFFGLSLMIISGFFIFISIKTIIPPPAIVTKFRFQIIENELKNVLEQNPENKIDIELFNSKKINIFDGWGNKIVLENKNNNHYRLISFGEDGISGGKPDIFYDIYSKNTQK